MSHIEGWIERAGEDTIRARAKGLRDRPNPSAFRARATAVAAKLPLQTALKLLGRWQGILVLNYHRIGTGVAQPWDPKMWSVSAEQLDRQLQTLARCAEVIDVCDVPAAMSASRGRRVLLTFDDGYRDNFELAFPLLRKRGLSAAFFLATGFLDSPHAAWWDEIAWMVSHASSDVRCAGTMSNGCEPSSGTILLPGGVSLKPATRQVAITQCIERYKALPDDQGESYLEELAAALGSGRCGESDAKDLWMTWDMAREMHAAGMSIGGHTVSHPVLARLPAERQREEITGCARRLGEELGVPMRCFAYPVGGRDSFTRLTREMLRECGVELAFSFYGGLAGASRWDSLDVPRVHVDAALAPRLLIQRRNRAPVVGRR
jgi:peptidoglycan/xylan/chitin deacetylase (PgdA/CDA1 family)